MPNFFDQFDSNQPSTNYFDQFDSQKEEPQQESRGITGAVADLGRSFAGGANSLMELGGTLYGLATGDMENFARDQGARGREYWNERKTPYLKSLEAGRKAKVDAAEGEWAKLGVSAWETLSSPSLLASYTFEQLPNLIFAGGSGRIAGETAKGVAKIFGKEATEKTVQKAAVGGAVGVGAAMQGSDVGGQAYDQLLGLSDEVWLANPMVQERINGNMDLLPRVKKEIARELSADAAIASGIVSVGINSIPMFRILESRIAGVKGGGASRLANVGKGFVGESLSEGLEEGSGAFAANVATQQVDPNQSLTEGVGEATGLGLMAGPMGGVAGFTQDTGVADVSRKIFEAPTVDDAIAEAEQSLNQMAGVDFEAQTVPRQDAANNDTIPGMDIPIVEFDETGIPYFVGPNREQGADIPGVDFRTRRDDEIDQAYQLRMQQEQSARERDYSLAFEQKADQEIAAAEQQVSEIESSEQAAAQAQEAADREGPSNPAMGNALLGAYLKDSPQSAQEAKQPRPAADVLASLDNLAVPTSKRAVTMPSGNPFPNERVAKSSLSYRNNPGAKIVPAQSGKGVVIEISERKDQEWDQFTPETGTLGIPRAEMPQIKAEHRGAMVNFLKGRFISSEKVDVPANSLKPTQAEFSREKVKQALEYEGGDRSILISSDGYVVDGHHQWLSKLDGNVQAIRIDAPIREILDIIKEFPSATNGTDTGATNNSAIVAGMALKAKSIKELREMVVKRFGPRAASPLEGAVYAAWNGRNQQIRKRINPDDSLAVAVAKLGGIDVKWREDMTGDSIDNKMVPGVGPTFSKNGTSPDDMASLLQQYGYLTENEISDRDGREVLAQLITDELTGGNTRFQIDSLAAERERLKAEEDYYAEQEGAEQAQREQQYAAIEQEHGQEAAEIARLYDDAHINAIDETLENIEIYEQQIQELENVRQDADEEASYYTPEAESGEPVRAVRGEAPGQPQETGRAGPQDSPDPRVTIQIAADSVEQLRKQDVARVIEAAYEIDHDHIFEVMSYINNARPDLRDAVQEAFDTFPGLKDSVDEILGANGPHVVAGSNQPAETRQSGYRIYKTSVRRDGASVERWAVQSNNNLLKEQKGERQIGGDALFSTKAEAIAEADAQAKVAERDKANQEASDQRQREESDQEAERKADDVNGFTSGMTALAAGRAKKALEKQFRFNGAIQTVRQRVESLAEKGDLELSTYQESKIKPMTRAQFNRATQREQDAHDKKMKEGGEVTIYLVNGSDLGKTGYDYAQHMQDKATASQDSTDFAYVSPLTGRDVEWIKTGTPSTGVTYRASVSPEGSPLRYGEITDRGNDMPASVRFETSDGETFDSLAKAKSHEMGTVNRRLVEDGYLQPAASQPAKQAPARKQQTAKEYDDMVRQRGEAYAMGYSSKLKGYSAQAPSVLRSKADKEAFEDGWIAAKSEAASSEAVSVSGDDKSPEASANSFKAEYPVYGEMTVTPATDPLVDDGDKVIRSEIVRISGEVPNSDQNTFDFTPADDHYRVSIVEREDGSIYSYTEYPSQFTQMGKNLSINFSELGGDAVNSIKALSKVKNTARKLFEEESGKRSSGDMFSATEPAPSELAQAAQAMRELTEAIKAQSGNPQSQVPKRAASYGQKNTLVTSDRAEELRQKLRDKLKNQLNSGVDPEMIALGAELAVYHIEAGARQFSEFVKAMSGDLGMSAYDLKKYLRSWYNGARDLMEDSDIDVSGMDTAEQVREQLGAISGENSNAERPARDSTRAGAKNEQSFAQKDIFSEGRGDVGQNADVARQEADGQQRDGGSVGSRGASSNRERSRTTVGAEKARLEKSAARDTNDSGSLPDSTGGLFDERKSGQPASQVTRQAASSDRRIDPAAFKSVKSGDLSQVKAQMPFLTEGQAEDVVFAENRLSKEDGFGVLFTNGTGTGKTFSGLGIIKRMAESGKTNILIAVPKQTIADAWIKAGAKFFDLDVTRLESTKDAGKGIVVTTYANLADNDAVIDREWDAIVADEAHYLSAAQDGKHTGALGRIRAMSLRSNTARDRVYAMNSEKAKEMSDLYATAKSYRTSDDQRYWAMAAGVEAKADAIHKTLDDLTQKEKERIASVANKDKPRGIFLSATPFSYEKSITWANEFLFDWGSNDDGYAYNSGGNFEKFMMQHFGYRMRYNKLTAPDAKVDSGLMQRAFNSWLKKEGALSGRALDSDFDYDRKFIAAESAVGRRVDDAIEWMRELSSGDNEVPGMSELYELLIGENFDYHARMYFLEAIKAREAVPYIKKNLELGRKVLVMHDFKKGGVVNPFRITPTDEIRDAYAMFKDEFSDLINAFQSIPSPIQLLSSEFPQAMIYNGSVSAKKRVAMQDEFNSDEPGAPVLMIAQGDAMREGVSIHDASGKHPRVLLHLGMPVKPTASIQQEGRIFRTGQASDAMFRYFTIGSSWERHAFASKIASRASAAENLAMGEQARGLKEAFINAYEEADLYEPGFDGEGKGGKETDQAYAQALTPWDMAKSYYFGSKKQGIGRSARGREHSEFFATPEPLGMKMVQWADIQGGESVLEPSAGNGAIARWLPDNVDKRAIEYTNELSSRLALHFDGDLITGDFMDHHVVNKYDAIVMNPPFGRGGKEAADHVRKAMTHLRDGGRIVALVPTGPAADKQFDKLLYEDDAAKDIYLAAEIALPSVTFERAGTSVSTRVLVLEKQTDREAARKIQQVNRDYSNADTIEEFFDRIEDSEISSRQKAAEPEPVKQAAPEAGGVETWSANHTKTGAELFMAKPKQRMEREEYQRVASIAKQNGGYWSRFGKAGFLFDSEESRASFVAAITPKDPLFSLMDSALVAPANQPGTRVEKVQNAIAQAVEKLKAQMDVRVVGNVTDLPMRIQRQIPRGARVKGVYFEGAVFLIADNLKNGREAQVTLAHELVGHKGVIEMLSADDWQDLRSNIDSMILAGSKSANSIGDEVSRRYGKEKNDVWYYEFMAVAAERRQRDGPIARLMRKLREYIRAALKAIGLKGPFSESDIDIILSASEAYLSSRTADTFTGRATAMASQGEFELDQQSEADITSMEDKRKADQKAALDRKNRDLADDQVDDFVLAGANSEADKAAARGQGSLFSAAKNPEGSYVSWGVTTDPVFDEDGNESESDEYALIEKIFVPEESRRDGAGRRMLRDTLREIQSDYPGMSIKIAAYPFGENKIDMTDLVEFYESEGFDIENTDSHAVIMEFDGRIRGENSSASNGKAGQKAAARGQKSLFSATTQTDTPAFRKWFGDSKVVDENGEPLRLYHGTSYTNIEQFLPDGAGERSKAMLDFFRNRVGENKPIGYMNFRSGTFFSTKPEYAGNYTAENTGVMYPVYIKAENPVYIDHGANKVWMIDEKRTPDAMILMDGDEINEIAVMDPLQIKSAIGNNGNFDPSNPSILFSAEQENAEAEQKGYQGESTGEALEWRQAVEKFGAEGMTTEARMARAAEMGFDTEQVLYHGTNAVLSEFSQDESREDGVTFLSSGPETASGFAAHRRTWNGANVIPAMVRGNFLEITPDYGRETVREMETRAESLFPDIKYGETIRDYAKRKGFAGIVFKKAIDDPGGPEIAKPADQYMVFNPANIRSINAAFDPDYRDRPNILFSMEPTMDGATDGTLPVEESEFAAENRRLREQDKTLWDKAKKVLRRQFAPGGLLPGSVFQDKIARDGKLGVVEVTIQGLVRELEKSVRLEFGVQIRDLSNEDMKILADGLAGKMPANIKPRTKTALVAMRQYIDRLSGQYIDILKGQMNQLTANLDQAERVLLDAYLEAGKVFATEDTPAAKGKATRERTRILDEAKAQATEIWGDGKRMQKSLEKVAEIAERASLMQKIMSNQGEYVHRSYKVFDDPKWFKKIPTSIHDAAMNYLIGRYMEDGYMTEEEATAEAENTIDTIIKSDTAYDDMEAFIKESKLGAKDLSALKTRKDIAPEIRALMGEHIDPRINFAKSATKMGRLIFNQKFLDSVKTNGMGVFLFNEKRVGTVQIAGDASDAYSPLNGLWTYRDVNTAFKDALAKEQMATWYRMIVQFNGMVKGGKTVLSPTTSARNFQSAMFFALANGHFDLTQAKKSMSLFRKFDNPEKLAYVKKMRELGVIYDNPYAEEMMDLLRESRVDSMFSNNKTVEAIRAAGDIARDIYSFGDDFWKVIGFENEKAKLLKYTDMTEAQAEAEAADRVRNLYPTYSMVGKAVQWIRRFPLAGTFVSFPAEIIRTTFNMAKTVKKDWDTPGMRPIAIQRAIGMSMVAGFAYAAQEIAKAAMGFDDDDEEAIRLQSAPWQKNSNIVVTGRDDEGNLQYFDISFLDPYNYFKRPITAIMRDQPFEDALLSSARDMLSPFFGTDIAAGALMEIYANKKESGGNVYKEADAPVDQLLDIATHLKTALQPGFVSNLERTYKAMSEERSPSGKKYDMGDEGLAWIGWRASTLDPKTALYYRTFDFSDAKADASKTLREVLNDPNSVTQSDIISAMERSEKIRTKAYDQMITLVQASKRSGMSNPEIIKVLRASNVSQRDIGSLINGRIPTYQPSSQSEAGAVKRAEALIGREKAMEIRERYRAARSLN